ncbi:MAG: hypothetical protein ACM3XN_02525 [Chloroflexota bacterium]
MSVTPAADALVLASVIAKSVDNIAVLSLKNAAGEYFRKAYQNKENVSATERKYTFYLTEAEGNDTIVGMSLYGEGATVALGSGTEICTQVVNIQKTATQSLLIYWTVRVV